MFVHGSNLKQKEHHATKYTDDDSKKLLTEIRKEYDRWSNANLALKGPSAKPSPTDDKTIQQRVKLFEEYKGFIDQKKYAENFDSRSNLHSTVIEEFMYYLFKDLVSDLGKHALIGKSHAFKDIFFVPPSFRGMLKRPHARIEIKDHDFVIGASIEATFRSSSPPVQELAQDGETVAETQAKYTPVAVTEEAERHLFDVPAVAIECKTYLDKTMLEGSSRSAEELKARNPTGLYIVVMEWIKLTEAVNLKKYKVDQIYVLREQKNTDREFRLLDDYVKNPVDPKAVFHLFSTVREHLTKDWTSSLDSGIKRGWLLD
jgi:hypothetical protein